VPPVTAERSPPLSRTTGALSPVIALSSTEATPSTMSPSPGISSPADTTSMPACSCDDGMPATSASNRALGHAVGEHVLASPAQRRGLRLAAALGHRLGEVGEPHGQPQPGRQAADEADVGGAGGQRVDEQERGEQAAELDDEHHRRAHHPARVELDHAPATGRGLTIAASNSGRAAGRDDMAGPLKRPRRFGDRAERQRRDQGQRPDQQAR
jgi:hypothetical protein